MYQYLIMNKLLFSNNGLKFRNVGAAGRKKIVPFTDKNP